jgi:hypothetical protein
MSPWLTVKEEAAPRPELKALMISHACADPVVGDEPARKVIETPLAFTRYQMRTACIEMNTKMDLPT